STRCTPHRSSCHHNRKQARNRKPAHIRKPARIRKQARNRKQARIRKQAHTHHNKNGSSHGRASDPEARNHKTGYTWWH
ncbi:MAG: hypothetical protein ACO37F_14225, partial [Pirellulales bacterium]